MALHIVKQALRLQAVTPNNRNNIPLHSSTIAPLQMLRRELPELLATLALDPSDHLQSWMHALDVKLLPKLQPDFPLVVAICGGGSAGKSTLFNSLIGRPMSPTGGRAGLNRRVLAALHPHHLSNAALFAALAHVFGTQMQAMTDAGQLTTPGEPVYCASASGPENVVLLDTPDIDTGARGNYANREPARQSLKSADAFVYIFTNATYNNCDNTDFISRLLTGIGTRPCFLVYRVYPSFSDDEVREHARTAAANLYGADDQRHVLGIFRADDDNRVAAGQMPMTMRSVTHPDLTLQAALADLDAKALRTQMIRSMTTDAINQGRQMVQEAAEAHRQLDFYVAALEAAQQKAVRQALFRFPTDRVLRRFADIWKATDPSHIKVMRRTGQVVEWPLKLAVSAVRALRTKGAHRPEPKAADDIADRIALDLLQAATGLYRFTVDSYIQDGAESIITPPVVRPLQEQVRKKEWQATLTHIQNQKELILSWSGQLEHDLKVLADSLRQQMGLIDQVRQTFSAMLNVLPATAAITYILHTGDAAGAVGIKVKLTGLLGLNDLYALIAIPATAGLKRADQQQLAQLLAPVAQTWLAHKLTAVQALFEEQITGEVFTAARKAQNRSAQLQASVDQALSALEETLT